MQIVPVEGRRGGPDGVEVRTDVKVEDVEELAGFGEVTSVFVLVLEDEAIVL
jgi:hypothetical protein